MTSFDLPWTRRQFVHRSSTTALLTAVPSWLASRHDARHDWSGYLDPRDPRAQARAARIAHPVNPETVRALVLRAVEAAKSAGATYAEARVTRVVQEVFVGAGLLRDEEDLGIGVRALANGAWGFAASPYWNLDEAARLGRDAVAQARTNARVSATDVELGSYPVATGSWTTPIRIDPFQIPIEEKLDFA
jgi:TldD protein